MFEARSITSAMRAALVATALVITSSMMQPASADQTSQPESSRAVSPVGVDAAGQALSYEETDSTESSQDSLAPYAPSTLPQFPTTIIDEDDRVRLTETRAFPNSAIVYIHKAGRQYCTGWMVSEDTLVTAGHCLYDPIVGSWTTGLEFSPGANGDERPFGTATATQMWTDVAWITEADPALDWGIVTLDQPLGAQTGWFGLRWQDTPYDGTTADLRGYPGDKPLGELWGMAGPITQSSPNQLCYRMDTIGGQSGSPVYTKGIQAIAIHAYGSGEFTGRQCETGNNAGTRITESLLNVILDLR